MKILKSCVCAAATLLVIFSLDAEEIIFDPLLTGWRKTSSKKVFADTEIKISKQCSVRLENSAQLRKSFEVEPNSKYERKRLVSRMSEAGLNRQKQKSIISSDRQTHLPCH